MSNKRESEQGADQAADQAADAGTEPGEPRAEPVGAVETVGAPQVIERPADQKPETSSDDRQDDETSNVGHMDAPFGYRADGTPRKSNAGRKAAPGVTDEKSKQRERLRSVTPSTHKPDKPAAIAAPALAVVNYQSMGEVAASLFFNVPAMVVGPEWLPDASEGEPVAVAGAFRDYFKATNMRDIPPGFALCLVLTVYSLKRASKPAVSSKLKSVGAWLKHNLRLTR